ncbi:MAG TPA: 4-alpha-glucanotransferase [Bryobacteraceae bacterium]
MRGRRESGVLLHPTSLPGRYGIGDLGAEAYRFADWLAEAGQHIWQVLPLGPTGYGESPYQLFSAFAGNPLLVSVDGLVRRGWLAESEVGPVPLFAEDRVDFEQVIPWKTKLLRRAFENFRRHAMETDHAELDDFVRENAAWLDDYGRFMALKEAHTGRTWTEWEPVATPDECEVQYHRFVQFEFFREWCALKAYCADRGIRVMGDVPIYVAHDSADVWAHPELFQLDKRGNPLKVSGVPPDYFSATGQLWGNPVYRWDRIAADGYRWWIDRMCAAFDLFDMVRMDHFRGFEAYWEVAATETTAIHGRWVKGPGSELFRVLQRELGELPLVAENLGVITPEVEAIRKEFGFPGMAILQFAFGKDAQAHDFKPHNYPRNLAAYTGTHDNDTVMSWWIGAGGASTRTEADVAEEKARARAYLNTDGREMNWVMIRALMASVADTVCFPVQDILGLGSEARMNTPAVASGNWRWRVREGALTPQIAARLVEMSELYERATKSPE